MKSIIIDDDINACDILAEQIVSTCDDLQLIGQTTNPKKGIGLIHNLKPDLVFLDIEMPEIDGFELLDLLPERNFWVVFTTSHAEYAIKALKMHALDYLLKPILTEDLHSLKNQLKAMQMLSPRSKHSIWSAREESYTRINSLKWDEGIGSLTVAHAKGLKIIRFSELCYIKANGPYCEFCLKDEMVLASRPMKYFEDLLPAQKFVKIHRSTIINMDFLSEYLVDDVPYAVMANGHRLEVAHRRRDDFMARLRNCIN